MAYQRKRLLSLRTVLQIAQEQAQAGVHRAMLEKLFPCGFFSTHRSMVLH
jgi:hypothetical protein